jgi:hypothetical protein
MQKESRKILRIKKETTKSEHHAPEHGVRGCKKNQSSNLWKLQTTRHSKKRNQTIVTCFRRAAIADGTKGSWRKLLEANELEGHAIVRNAAEK